MIVLGRLVAPYGLKGWMWIHPFGDDPLTWHEMPALWLGSSAEPAEWIPMRVLSIQPHGKGLITRLDGIRDRTAAERYAGYFIGAPRDALPETAVDEFYWGDLLGLQVVNESGVLLGVVSDLLEAGSNTVLVVREGDKERLLPFVAQVVKGVDVAAGCINVEWEQDW